MKALSAICLLSVLAVGFAVADAPRDVANAGEPVVVFVCEHGAAKSIVAASYFNKLARERNLSVRAVARGTEPQETLAASAEKGLHADGLAQTEQKPKPLTPAEAARAKRVVAFLPLAKEYYDVAKVSEWNDVPATGEDYGKARDKIVAHLNELLTTLEAENNRCAHAAKSSTPCKDKGPPAR